MGHTVNYNALKRILIAEFYDDTDKRFIVTFPLKSKLILNDSQYCKIPDDAKKALEAVGITLDNSWFHFWEKGTGTLYDSECKVILLERASYCLLKEFLFYAENRDKKEFIVLMNAYAKTYSA